MPEWVYLVGLLLSNIGTYWLSARKASGRVDVTEASQLWKEAASARKELRRRIKQLEIGEIGRRIEIHELRSEMTKLHFIIAGNVPDDLREAFLESSREHIEALRHELEEKRMEPINGNGS